MLSRRRSPAPWRRTTELRPRRDRNQPQRRPQRGKQLNDPAASQVATHCGFQRRPSISASRLAERHRRQDRLRERDSGDQEAAPNRRRDAANRAERHSLTAVLQLVGQMREAFPASYRSADPAGAPAPKNIHPRSHSANVTCSGSSHAGCAAPTQMPTVTKAPASEPQPRRAECSVACVHILPYITIHETSVHILD
jgi:hypothetical protein